MKLELINVIVSTHVFSPYVSVLKDFLILGMFRSMVEFDIVQENAFVFYDTMK